MSIGASEPKQSEFFVGYAPLSRSGLRHWLLIGGGLIGLSALLAITLAGTLKPKASVPKPEQFAEFTGYFVSTPYPHLRERDGGGSPRILLLAGGGKGGIGAGQSESGPMRVRGRLLERHGTRLLSDAALEPDPSALDSDLLNLKLSPPSLSVELVGEIIDPKCAFGRMLPGRGAAHRACAQMCIRGGVPPLLLWVDPDGVERHALIVSPEGDSAAMLVLPYVGEPVSVRGDLRGYGDLAIIILNHTTPIQRL